MRHGYAGRLNREMFYLTLNPLKVVYLCMTSVVRILKAKSCMC